MLGCRIMPCRIMQAGLVDGSGFVTFGFMFAETVRGMGNQTDMGSDGATRKPNLGEIP